MKELSIEEKAKAYDEAISLIKDYNRDEEGFICVKPENIFPALKESEDEKVKKELIDFLWKEKIFLQEAHSSVENNPKYRFVMDAIAWLEKQSYTKKDIDDAYLKGITDTKNEMEKQYEANYQIRKDIATFIFNYRGDIKDRAKWMNYLGIKVSFVEKQDEQNHCMIQWKGDNLKRRKENKS